MYIVSTHDEIIREQRHKSVCNNENCENYNLNVYNFIRANGGYENWNFEVIEHYPCDNKIELKIRERYYYDLLNPGLNTYRPYTTEEERKEECRIRSVKHREENQEEIKKYDAKYREDNIEKINKKFTCECGGKYIHQNKARHCDTNKHKKFIENKKLNTI